ncbi:FAD-dependent oxidoreductase [Proteiniclasticum ruminis]|uniref:Flavin containing amine oxidoreductase n=1 Tax=Proteiniclasticum ruminis TaxID=398199 RepID=A0A1I5DEJ5_9CLOT|nr:FAD-dependent oxidoreductase [Proteiniclasticum ruminis]SFN97556.1 Flavin containing amine oxidoreductase [Proteiniclasticum ruminis]
MHIAVIGGGFSGLLAAYLLQKKDIHVTVYEKENLLGGHLRTLYCHGLTVEIGTAAAFSPHLKELLLELDISYTERFTYRNFLDENHQKVEQLSHKEVVKLIEELPRYEALYSTHFSEKSSPFYGEFGHLKMPLCDFLTMHDLPMMRQVIAPHLSAYGFGAIEEVPAYYALHTFDPQTIKAIIRGDKLLFVDEGMQRLMEKLSEHLKDIRYGAEVIQVEPVSDKVRIDTAFHTELYDQVLVTTKLPKDVLKDDLYNDLMKKIDTNPYVTCTYEVENKNIVTTYYKANAGKKECLQFFNVYKDKEKTILVAYTYGHLTKNLAENITEDLIRTGIEVKHLIMAKQWYIFPHLKTHNLTEDFYRQLLEHQKKSPICLTGTLMTKPSISHLYEAIKTFIQERFS